MNKFRVGDFVKCIDNLNAKSALKLNQIFKVRGITSDTSAPGIYIRHSDHNSHNETFWYEYRFVKVTPSKLLEEIYK